MKRFELVTKKVFRGELSEEFVIPGKKKPLPNTISQPGNRTWVDHDWSHSQFASSLFISLRPHIDAQIVPGLADDPAQGVRRGKFRMTGTEVSKIFEPVVQEVVRYVTTLADQRIPILIQSGAK